MQWFWGNKPNKLTVLGLLLGLIGVFVLVTIHNIAINNSESKFSLSIFFLLVSGLAWAVGVMLQTRAVLPYSSFTISGIQLIVGGGVSLILSYLIEDFGAYHLNSFTDFFSLPIIVYKGFFYLMLIGSIGGFAIFNWVSQKANPTLVSTYTYVNPLVAIGLGNIFFEEQFHTQMLLAGLLIISSVIVITFAKNSKS
jgi:drug/metabolite transporter (DMT)-like permease